MGEREADAYAAIQASKVGIDIEKQKASLLALRSMKLTDDEQKFVTKVKGSSFILEHRAKDEKGAGWHAIKGYSKTHEDWGGQKNVDASLLSLFELSKLMASRREPPVTQLVATRGVRKGQTIGLGALKVTDVDYAQVKEMLGSVQINTSLKDFQNFGNIDFVFFKLGIPGHVNLEKGFAGVAAGKPKFFKPDRLWTDGWITLDDWVSYSAGGKFVNNLLPAWYGFPASGLAIAYETKTWTKTYTYTSYKTIKQSTFAQVAVTDKTVTQVKKELKQEVFFGPDIKDGLALTLVEHLRAADITGTFVKGVADGKLQNKHIAGVIGNIWRLVEAKLPGTMRYYDYKIKKKAAAGEEAF